MIKIELINSETKQIDNDKKNNNQMSSIKKAK